MFSASVSAVREGDNHTLARFKTTVPGASSETLADVVVILKVLLLCTVFFVMNNHLACNILSHVNLMLIAS